MSKFTQDWLRASLVRAIRTVAQTALSMMAIGMTITEVDWVQVASVSAVAGIFSVLTSVATDLPEL